MTKICIKQIILALPLLLLPPTSSLASGIQASPARMEFKVEAGKTASQELVVANPTTDVQLFQVYPDEFANLISANPSSFTLEAGSRKSVEIKVKTDGSPSVETLNTNLSVTAKPLTNAQFSANTGIKIPLSINIISPKQKTAAYKNMPWLAGLVIVLLGWLFYSKRKQK